MNDYALKTLSLKDKVEKALGDLSMNVCRVCRENGINPSYARNTLKNTSRGYVANKLYMILESIFSENNMVELADEISALIKNNSTKDLILTALRSNGMRLTDICDDVGFNYNTAWQAISGNREGWEAFRILNYLATLMRKADDIKIYKMIKEKTNKMSIKSNKYKKEVKEKTILEDIGFKLIKKIKNIIGILLVKLARKLIKGYHIIVLKRNFKKNFMNMKEIQIRKTSRPNLKKRVDSAIILCGFNLYSYCAAYGIEYNTLRRAIMCERTGGESQKTLRRLSSFFKEYGYGELAYELRETARLMEMGSA